VLVAGGGLVVVVRVVPPVPGTEVTGGVVVPPQPTRDEVIETSSYQKVLVSPPYDSQPK
jgi:hypothetical protein